MKLNQYDIEDLVAMYKEVITLRKNVLEYVDNLGYYEASALTTRKIEQDIERQIGKEYLKKLMENT